jgi:hypothetical protein
MAAQTSYSLTQSAAYDGLLADINPKTVISRDVETAAGITFGKVVSRGTADSQVVLGGDGTGLGIAVRDLAQEGAQGTGVIKYDQYEAAAILVEGYCWVAINTASASPGSALFYNDTTGAIEAGTASTGETQLNATLETTITSSGQLGLIRLDSPAMQKEADAVLTAAVATNTAGIATNVTDIATNAADILTNAGDITTNASAIAAIMPNQETVLQTTAASATVRSFVASGTGVITGVYAAAGATAAAGESLTVDVQINGVSCLSSVITLDAAATTVAQAGTIDTAADDIAAGDIITVVFAYTAGGGPTRIVDTLCRVYFK